MEFGQRLKVQRQKHELTQAQLAKQLVVSRQTISSWETGKSYPDIGMLIKISDYLLISLDTLLREDLAMKKYLETEKVVQKITPVEVALLVADLGLLAILLGTSFKLLVISPVVLGILIIIAIADLFGIIYLYQLKGYTGVLNSRYNNKRFFKILLIVGSGLVALGASLIMVSGVISGFSVGLGMALIIWGILGNRQN